MRRLDEHLDAMPTHSGAGVVVGTSRRPSLPVLVFLLVCALIAPYLGLGSRVVDPRIAEIWPMGGVGFVVLTAVWRSGTTVVAGVLGSMALVFAVTAVSMGFSPLDATWLGLLGVGQPLLMALVYRRHLQGRGWVPETPHDVAAMLGAAVASSLVLGLLGGFPGLAPFDVSQVLLWWVIRNTVYCFGAGVTVLVLLFARPSQVLSPSPYYHRVGLLVVALLCVYGTYQDPELPLSWLLIVPCVWGGLTLTLRGAGWLLLTISLIAAGLTYLPQNQFGYNQTLPAASIVDLLVVAGSTFALLLTLLREQRGQLIARLDLEVSDSERQRTLLTAVFESMNDGVLIMDRSGVRMHNTAARQLLGRAIPTHDPGSWVQHFDLSGADGRELRDEMLLEHLLAAPSASSPPVDVRVGSGGTARILDVRAQVLGADDEQSSMVLLHDVTSQRARVRELGNFAGMVAHDLRGPLTVLDGWLEVAQDEIVGPGPVDDAVARAHDASQRMRRVIEDWLAYSVVQNGQLRPDTVKLAEVVAEIVRGQMSVADEGEGVLFDLDLTHSVQADPALLRQLLDNLVGNAVKYTPVTRAPEVGIVSTADLEPGWVRIEVSDRGSGVPEGEEEQIFEEFHRGPVQGRSAGTGLGLALARRIVALHGGVLSARRNPEGGSTFSFTLPQG